MPKLTDRDKRTVRLAGLAIGVYLALFFGLQGWKYLEAKRTDYLRLTREAEALRLRLAPYQDKVMVAQKLMETFHLDPAKLSKVSVVADASAAIQRAATGLQLGPIRETAGRTSAKELATIQFEASGPVPALMALFSRLETVGFPVIIDAVQLSADPRNPMMIKLNLTIIILDFEQWKVEEVRHA